MTRRIYWGLAILIILLAGVSVVTLTRTTDTEPVPVYKDVEPSQKLVKSVDKEQITKTIGHYHSDGTWHEGTHTEHANVPENPTFSTVPEKVIYPHQKLLDTHPVAALLAQAKDRGHWSAKYIPPFPADDAEANELARAIYIYVDHFKIKGFTDDDPETKMPAIREAMEFIWEFDLARHNAFVEAGHTRSARDWDLRKLEWACLDSLHLTRLDRIPSNFNNQGKNQ